MHQTTHRASFGGNILARNSDICVLQHLISGQYLAVQEGVGVLSQHLTERCCKWSLQAHAGPNEVRVCMYVCIYVSMCVCI
jgi:hypothetical protein